MNCCTISQKTKKRTSQEKKGLVNRISRIEGQVKGIKQMIEDDRYCDDILIQIAAVHSSLKKLGMNMLENHMNTCLKEELANGNDEIIKDVITIFSRLK